MADERKPVDVLAVLDEWIRLAALTPETVRMDRELRETRGAVAALIKTAEHVNAMSIQSDAHRALRAALAACRGGAK